MTVLTATEARVNLYKLLDEVAATHEPILITGKRTNAAFNPSPNKSPAHAL